MNDMSPAPTLDLTVREQAAAIANRSISPITVVENALSRIERLDSVLHAWAFVDAEGARAQAAEYEADAAAGRLRGPLHGVPVGIKDVLHVQGMPTVANSRTTDPKQSHPDSAVAAALRAAGAIIIGKCATVEFAGAGDPPDTRNPWNTEHTPGGSSAGSGAAVGARMVPLAIGTQTGGSNLRPAAYCGIAGFKPTYGGLSRQGVFPLAWSLDHVGLIARSAADLGYVYRAIAPVPPAAEPIERSWKVGLVRSFFLEGSDQPTVKAMESAAGLFAAGGATVAEPALPDIFSALKAVHSLLLSTESATFHASRLADHPDTTNPKTRATVQAYSLVPAAYYLQAMRIRRLIRDELLRLFEASDVLIMPTTPAPAPHGIESTGDASFLSPWSLVGFPAATVPCGLSPDGLPIGLQIVGPSGADGRVLAAAEFAELHLGRLTLPEI
jgi:aspartyl-tRNA(Asn)/glutamyl-tRNA(Gln) amidotransferase subunit A